MERIVLRADERRQVAEIVADVLPGRQEWDLLDLVGTATTEAQRLPLRLRSFLARAREREVDVALVSGLPVSDDLPPTPAGWDMAAKTGAGRREELVLLLCGAALGDPFGWASQQDGRVVHDVCPAPGMESSMTSSSSEASLSLHTEDIFHPCRGDYVSLYCLRNPDAVGTTFVRVDALDLPAASREVLAQDRYRFYPDDSHVGAVLRAEGAEDHLAGRAWTTGSVLFGPADAPYLRFDVDFMAPGRDDEPAAEAMRLVGERMAGAVERIVLHPGDAVFVDNYRVVHGREPFEARYDGNDRWLKRLNLIRDVRRIYATSTTRSRIIA